jgi:hypothetical protein
MNQVDASTAKLLIDASAQAYNAFDKSVGAECQCQNVTSPPGFSVAGSWTGVDSVLGSKSVECFGVVFCSNAAPHRYIFAFRGTTSWEDWFDDLRVKLVPFVPHGSTAAPGDALVEHGFLGIYTDRDGNDSMQTQLFALVDQYNASDKPISELYITGHSLGSALSQLFTLDLALARPAVRAINYNYACPRVGNQEFVDLYQQQPAQTDPATRTVRFQNTYDAVPCTPPESQGYGHTSPALLVAFYEDKIDLKASHAIANYQAVLKCATEAPGGVCVGTVGKLTSILASTTTVCEV